MKIIAGPCQHESYEQSHMIAKECKRVCDIHGIEYYFKASYDKANRTSFGSVRGVGIRQTLSDFLKIKQTLDVKTLTDVHETSHVSIIKNSFSNSVDVIQIPAFLCRQTDLIREASQSGMIVNVKKGQFLAPWDVSGILSKTQGAKEVWITERGTSFGYNRLVVDFTGIDYMLQHFDCQVVLDATHAVQQPGGMGTSSCGNRDYVSGLCRAASALGVENFFLEVHPEPDNAPSDGPNMIQLEDFEKTVEQIVKYHYTENKNE